MISSGRSARSIEEIAVSGDDGERNVLMRALQRLPIGAHVVWLDQVLPMNRKDAFEQEAIIGYGQVNQSSLPRPHDSQAKEHLRFPQRCGSRETTQSKPNREMEAHD